MAVPLLEISSPNDAAPFLHTGILEDGASRIDIDEALEYAEFFGLSPAKAHELLENIQKAVSCWQQEAHRANAGRHDIEYMDASFGYTKL